MLYYWSQITEWKTGKISKKCCDSNNSVSVDNSTCIYMVLVFFKTCVVWFDLVWCFLFLSSWSKQMIVFFNDLFFFTCSTAQRDWALPIRMRPVISPTLSTASSKSAWKGEKQVCIRWLPTLIRDISGYPLSLWLTFSSNSSTLGVLLISSRGLTLIIRILQIAFLNELNSFDFDFWMIMKYTW